MLLRVSNLVANVKSLLVDYNVLMNKKLRSLIFGIWGISGGLALTLVLFFWRGGLSPSPSVEEKPLPSQTASPIPASETPTLAPSPTLTATSTPTASPSPQPTSTSTPVPNLTPTYMPLTPSATSSYPMEIGFSVMGRPLEVYQFGTGPTERLIIAGVHGGYEWNTIALADELIQYIENYPKVIPSEVTLYILRALNPDGEARSHGAAGRANENGVDINRNFPAFWQADWSRKWCWDYLPITAGSIPVSEPETAAVINFVHSHNIDALISYHSAGLGIFPGGKPPDPISKQLADALASVSDYPYPPINTGCQYTGQLADWASLEGIAAVDIELTTHEETDLEQNMLILSIFLNWKPSVK